MKMLVKSAIGGGIGAGLAFLTVWGAAALGRWMNGRYGTGWAFWLIFGMTVGAIVGGAILGADDDARADTISTATFCPRCGAPDPEGYTREVLDG